MTSEKIDDIYELSIEDLMKLDNIKLSQRTIIMNDAEAAFNLCCPGDFGILVTVGTGIICMSRNSEGKSIRQAGQGHDQGDIGSGYWIGKQVLNNLILNESFFHR